MTAHPFLRIGPLGLRMLLGFLAILLTVQLAGFFVIRQSIDRNAVRHIDDQLIVGERVLRRVLAQNEQTLIQSASVLATDYGLRDALASADAQTIRSALDNHGARIGAVTSALLDPNLAQQHTAVDAALLAPMTEVLSRQQGRAIAAGTLAVVGRRAYQFVAVPIKAPLLIGWAVMGFEIGRPLVEDMQQLSGLHVTLLTQPGNAPLHVAASSLSMQEREGLGELSRSDHEFRLRDERVVGRWVELAGGGTAEPLVALLLNSFDEAVASYHQLQKLLLLITALGVLVFVVAGLRTASRLTRPLQRLTLAARRLGDGDYDTPVGVQGRSDEIAALGLAFEQMRERVAEQRHEVMQLAFWDKLTGLPNRAKFRAEVDTALRAGDPRCDRLAVLMLNLDRFKHVNDVLGYAFGDRLLQGVAQRLSAMLGEGQMAARLGGDELAVLLPGASCADALALAQAIVRSFELPLRLDDHTVDLSAGIGVACWPEHAGDADSLLSHAEVAMHAAKRKTSGPQVYDAAADSSSALTLSLLSELRHAIDHDELRLYLQPKVAVAGGQLLGAEALVRWQHPQRGLVPPMQFIPFAEQTGFVRALTLWVFEQTAYHWRELSTLGLQRVSINLSTRDLMDQDLPDKLQLLLQRHAAPAEAICLEITESAIMDDPLRAEATLNRLAQLGFKLSIDDFGTGYSSLAYLQRLPVHELKIDRSFVMGMEHGRGDATIVRSTIDLAHNLGLSVVAEGVENADVLRQLEALHCDEAQGYFIARPMPAADMRAWAARWPATPPNPAASAPQNLAPAAAASLNA